MTLDETTNLVQRFGDRLILNGEGISFEFQRLDLLDEVLKKDNARSVVTTSEERDTYHTFIF